jgi:hypothetical protein
MARSRPTPAWRIAAWLNPIAAVLAILLGGIRSGYSLRFVLFWGIAGAAIGGMLVPEIEPRSVRVPALWQVACGAVGGALIALALETSAVGIVVGALVGLVLGWLSPYWLKYFDL